ncbi:MAG: M17 family metallopeptidase [Sphingomonadaceae bacterium]
MTDFAPLLLADREQLARTIHLVDKDGFPDWLKQQPQRVRTAIDAQRFKAEGYELAILPSDDVDDWSVVLGVANVAELSPWCLAKAGGKLPEGSYRLASGDPGPAALGWLLAQHRFDRYQSDPDPRPKAVLLSSNPAMIDAHVRMTEAVALARDLIDTPAADMGPAELAGAVEAISRELGGEVSITQGEALDAFPMIAAVGRAAARDRGPRLIEFHWGDPSHPRIAIIGKGVCFDSGGLDLKPSSAMLWMKKDMGGAAHAIALCRLIVSMRLPIRLHLLIPAVENAVSGNAFRPGDILRSRKGITVEIGNTDAEGRLILADALTKAVEEEPAMIIDFATLTGAARVALGPDLPALFSNSDSLVADLQTAATSVDDPLWRLPLWKPYAEMLKSTAADVNNAGEGGMAGAITAALFLDKFVPDHIAWAHIDTFAWRSSAKPGRPKGGDALGLRAVFEMIFRRYS